MEKVVVNTIIIGVTSLLSPLDKKKPSGIIATTEGNDWI